jgi:hypothetical protein
MKTKLLAILLVAGSSMFAQTRFSVGVNVGAPFQARFGAVARPAYPGPGYVWVDAYRDAYGNWCNGYWAAPQYGGGAYFTGGYRGDERRDFGRNEVRRDVHNDYRPETRNNNVRQDSRGYDRGFRR